MSSPPYTSSGIDQSVALFHQITPSGQKTTIHIQRNPSRIAGSIAGDVDDAATTVFAHQLAGFDRHEEIAANVHVDGFLEGTEVGVQDVAETWVGRGVVDQNVEAAELFLDPGEDLADL